MTLLQEIQSAAVDANIPVTTLLRKCQVLAARLKHQELRNWTAKELSGYDPPDSVPEYRKLAAPAYGHLAGPFNSGYKNISIPPMLLPEKLRHLAEQVNFSEPIAEIEELGRGSGEVVTANWPGDVIAYMQVKSPFSAGLVLYGAWQQISKAAVLGIIDTVRNRVLDFALQLEAEAPQAGELNENGAVVSGQVVTNIYKQTIIHGSVTGNVATGDNAVQISTIEAGIKPADLGSLVSALQSAGVPKQDVEELSAALAADPSGSLADKPKTRGWLKNMFEKTLSGTVTLAKDVTVDVLAQAISRYLGGPPAPGV